MSVEAAVRAFLDRLRRRVRLPAKKTELPPADDTLRAVEPSLDLAARFVASAEAAGCRVHRVGTADWTAQVARIVTEHRIASVLVQVEPGTALTPERAADLTRVLADRGVSMMTETSDAVLFDVGAAVTGVLSATAETGTLVCASGAASARGATLIPPVHIAVVDQSQLVADLYDTFAWLRRRDELPANVNLITGPSKTADIEGVLVTGMHGPGVVHVILLEPS
ncbi:MAG: lactate utilization protein [Planctomycetota bacterium]